MFNAMHWFWISAVLGTLCALVFGLAVLDRRWGVALINGLAAALNLTIAVLRYDGAYGECSGKSGTTVPFHQGMTICPGQTAVVDPSDVIRMPVIVEKPATDRAL